MEIIENITSDQFMTIFFVSYSLFILDSCIRAIIEYIQNRAWLVSDYEKIIHKNLGTYDGSNSKEKELIAKAKVNVEKRDARRKKIKSIFKKGKKSV